MENFINSLQSRGILTVKRKGVLSLKTPLKIIVPRAVQDKIKATYRNNAEFGGFLRGGVQNGTINIIDAVFLPNVAQNKTTSYAANLGLWQNTIRESLNANLLPFAFHTHPTSIGHSWYDHKKENFYLRASGADRRIGRTPFSADDVEILLPDVIAVGGDNYSDGIDLAFYEGGIFPPSLRALSNGQLGAVIVFTIALLFVANKKVVAIVFVAALFWFFGSLYLRPSYRDEPNGDLVVTLN